jgi:hypothetical protein
MQFSYFFETRYFHQPGVFAAVKGKMKQLIIQEISCSYNDKKPAQVFTEQVIYQKPHRNTKSAKKENHQNHWKQGDLVILMAFEWHVLIGEKPVVLLAVPDIDLFQAFAWYMHHIAMPEVLHQIGIHKSDWNHQPFIPNNIFQLANTPNDYHRSDQYSEGQMHIPNIPAGYVLLAELLAICIVVHVYQSLKIKLRSTDFIRIDLIHGGSFIQTAIKHHVTDFVRILNVFHGIGIQNHQVSQFACFD